MLGTLMGIGGAMLMTFYKGVEINIWSTHVNLLHKIEQPSHYLAAPTSKSEYTDRVLGSLLAIGSSFGYAFFFIFQVSYQFLFHR